MPSFYAFIWNAAKNDKKTPFVESWIIIEMTSVSKNKVILEERQCMFMLKLSNDAVLKPENVTTEKKMSLRVKS